MVTPSWLKRVALPFLLSLLLFCGKKTQLPAPTGPIVPADSVCFERDVSPVLAVCAGCHSAVQPPLTTSLTGYDNIKTNIDAIIAATEAGRMPKGGPSFTSTQVGLLKNWKSNGTPHCP